MNLGDLGILGIFVFIILAIISLCFGIVTATLIATAVGATGLNWWIVTITILGALCGGCGSLISIGRD